jgi:hypothetical protein
MTPPKQLSNLTRCFILALVILGLIGGSYILAHAGFGSSSKTGANPIFVPLPQAYILAALLYALSGIAALVLLRSVKRSR